MTDEKMLELAAQADLITSAGIVHYAYADRLERFAALVRRDALEEAAKICDRRATATLGQDATQHTHAKRTEARNCGFAIRALAAKEES